MPVNAHLRTNTSDADRFCAQLTVHFLNGLGGPGAPLTVEVVCNLTLDPSQPSRRMEACQVTRVRNPGLATQGPVIATVLLQSGKSGSHVQPHMVEVCGNM